MDICIIRKTNTMNTNISILDFLHFSHPTNDQKNVLNGLQSFIESEQDFRSNGHLLG